MLLGTRWLWDPGGFGILCGSGDPNVPLGSTPGLLVALGPRWLWDPWGFGVPDGLGDTKVLAGIDPGAFRDTVALGSRGFWGPLMVLGSPRSWQSRSRCLWGHDGFGIHGILGSLVALRTPSSPWDEILAPGCLCGWGRGHLWGGFLGPLVAFGVPDGLGVTKVLAEEIQVLLGT